MVKKNIAKGGAEVDASKLTISRILAQLTISQIVSVVSIAGAVFGAVFYLGSVLDPTVQSLKEENRRLVSALAGVDIGGGNGSELSLDTFVARKNSQMAGLEALHGDRLFAPSIPPPWIPMREWEDSLGRAVNVANDLTILARAAGLSEASVKELFPGMWNFNTKNPPLLWTVDATSSEPSFGTWFPYIQVSVIARDDAQVLMKAVNGDSSAIFLELLKRMRSPFHRNLSDDGRKLFDKQFEEFLDPSRILRSFIDTSFSSDERSEIFSGLGNSEEVLNQQLDALSVEAAQAALAYLEMPFELVDNGMGSLSEVTPESGLLLGRLLFYVFSTSKSGRVDIEHMTVGYSGSYARTRRAIDHTLANGASKNVYVFDHILIVSTKSDFCLVHIRVPHFSERLRDIDQSAQAWLRQIRLRELR